MILLYYTSSVGRQEPNHSGWQHWGGRPSWTRMREWNSWPGTDGHRYTRCGAQSKGPKGTPPATRTVFYIIYFFYHPIGIFRKLFSTQTIFINIFPTPIYRLLLPIKVDRQPHHLTNEVAEAEPHNNIIVVYNLILVILVKGTPRSNGRCIEGVCGCFSSRLLLFII